MPGPDERLLEVLHCGLCPSDASMLDNCWAISSSPLVAGHEAVGRVIAVGEAVDPGLIGEWRGVGWVAGSCSWGLEHPPMDPINEAIQGLRLGDGRIRFGLDGPA